MAGIGPMRPPILDKFVPHPFEYLDFSHSELFSTKTS